MDFCSRPYSVSMPAVEKCKVLLGGERMEEVKQCYANMER